MDLANNEKFQSAELKTYNNISSLSLATGIDRKYFKMAKKRNLPGFKTNNTINWTEAKPAFELLWPELQEEAPTDIAAVKLQIAEADVKLKNLQIKKLEKNLIEPDEVKQLMVELATNQSVVLKRVFSELPPKLAGKGEPDIKAILDMSLQEVFTVLQKRIQDWK